MWTLWCLFYAVFLGGVLLGYHTGRRTGQREGFQQGLLYAPLELRRRTLLEDHCLTCGRPLD